MSTTAEAPAVAHSPRAQDGAPAVRPITLGRVVRSEWIKLRSLRSTWAMLGSIVLVLVGFAALAAAVSAGSVSAPSGDGRASFDSSDPLRTVLTGAEFGILLLAVMGVLAGAREYASRMITTTVAAVPRRWQVVVAKVIVLAAVVIPTALVSTFGAYGVGTAVLSANDAETVSLADADVLTSVAGMAAYMTAIAVLGLAIGILLRSIASSIAVVVAGVMILPNLAGALLPDSWDSVLKFLPEQSAASFTVLGSGNDPTLGGAAGAAVLVGWVVAGLVAAVAAILRRDV